MRSPSPLPPRLHQGAFSTKDARDAGVSGKRLRHPELEKPFHGARISRRPEDGFENLLLRCRALAASIRPDAFFCGPTAALLFGAPLPPAAARLASTELVVGTAAPIRSPKGAGVRGRTLQIDPADIVTIHGIRCTSSARTVCDLGADLPLPDLVAVADYLVHHAALSPDELRRAATAHTARRGRPTLLEAIRLVDGRAESHPESVVRIALLTAGIGPLAVQYEIRDDAGRFIARADLAVPDARVAIEYLGDYHRVERDRWMKDRERTRRMRAAGWTTVELTALDLRDLTSALESIRAEVLAGIRRV